MPRGPFTSARQRRAINILVENGGKIGVSNAMVQAGYSPMTAKTPSKLTRTRAWVELMDEFLGDDLLAEVHNELLHNPNYKARTSGLDMAYKLRAKYAAEKRVNVNVDIKATEELDEKAKLLGFEITKGYDQLEPNEDSDSNLSGT